MKMFFTLHSQQHNTIHNSYVGHFSIINHDSILNQHLLLAHALKFSRRTAQLLLLDNIENILNSFRSLSRSRCDHWPKLSPKLWKKFVHFCENNVCPLLLTIPRRFMKILRSLTDSSPSLSLLTYPAWFMSRLPKVTKYSNI